VWADIRAVLGYRNVWLLAIAPGAFSGIVLTFAGLWGVPFLVSQYGFTTPQAAGVASAMLIAWSASSLAYGPLSERIGRRKPLFIGGLVATLALWAAVVLVPGHHPVVLVGLLVFVGIAAGAFILVFAFAKESVPAHLGGTVSGIANMGVMLGGLVMQPVVGLVLDLNWHGTVAAGMRYYEPEAWSRAFSLMFAWGALSAVALAFTRETHCRQLR
jgi:MFS family permease